MDGRNEILFASKPCISIDQLRSEFMNLFFTVSFFFSQTHPVTDFNSHKTSAPQISLFFVFFCFLGILLIK